MRFLLTTVGRHDDLLREMLALTRPGGVAALQEADVVTPACYPPHPAWEQLKAAFIRVFERTGSDAFAGRRLFGMLCRAGLTDVGFRPFVLGFTHDHPMTAFMPSTTASMRDAIVEAGVMSEAQLDDAIAACERHLANPDVVSTSVLIFQAWGQKPRGTPGARG